MSNLKQLNTWIEPDLIDEVDALVGTHYRSKADVMRVAIRSLTTLIEAHQTFTSQLKEQDLADLYMELAREAPAHFIDVPQEGLRAGHSGDIPAIVVDNWLIFPDRTNGGLLAEEQGGDGRLGKIVNGEIVPVKMPSASDVTLN